jgi:hypothetical protein
MRRLVGLLFCPTLLTACGSPLGDGGLTPTPTSTAIPVAAIAATANVTATSATPASDPLATATRSTPVSGTPATATRAIPASGTPATPIPVRPAPAGTPGTTGTPQLATPTSGATTIQLFAPYRPNGLAGSLHVLADLNGYCWAGSETLHGRPDAWRCTSDNRILDPCIEAGNADPTALACAASPWSAEITLLTLTAPLPRDHANTAGGIMAHPWGLQLANGARCQLATGATATVAGLRINATCSDGSYTVGDPDRSRARWRIFVMHDSSPNLELQEIIAAWY